MNRPAPETTNAIEAARRWEAVLDGPARAPFERALAAWIAARRWYRTKTKRVQSARIAHAFPLPVGAERARVLLVDLALEDGARDTYVAPIAFLDGEAAARLRARRPAAIVAPLRVDGREGALVDALALEPFLADLLASLGRGAKVDADGATLRFHALPALAAATASGVGAAPVDREQTNTSVVFGDRLVGKIVRKLDPGESADLEVGRFLTAAGYDATPALAGWIDVTRGGDAPSTVALFHRFVANRGDAWEHALATLDRYLDEASRRDAVPPRLAGDDLIARAASPLPPDVAAVVGPYAALAERLGERIGAMHAALARGGAKDDAAFSPEPLDRATRATLGAAARRDLAEVLASLKQREGALSPSARRLLEEVRAREPELSARLLRVEEMSDAGLKTRVHGDLHLGQVLFTGDDFVLIDFEGEPARPLRERKAKRSPLVDVAGMLRSFHYAVVSALRARPEASRAALAPWGALWNRAASAMLVRGWLRAVRGAHVLPEQDDARRALLDFFLFEKAIYEVRYEANNRPDWVDIPLEGLRELLGAKTTTAVAAAMPEVRGAMPSRPNADDLAAFAEGRALRAHEILGAHARPDGSTDFAVWAPRAARVSIVGEFAAGGGDGVPLTSVGRGVFVGSVAGARPGHRYALRIVTPGGEVIEKTDPFGTLQDDRGTSVITKLEHAWGDEAWMRARPDTARLDRPMSIYEVHLGSWRRVPEEGSRPLTYREIAEPLARYVKTMGFTHVELMPLLEHPFYGSWGYGVTGFFAATHRYGTPSDLMYMVDVLHQHGIGVILDWVPAHFALDAHGLARFDGDALFEPTDPARRVHPTWRTGLFEYARPEVRSFLLSSAMFWVEAFHADGLRVDGVESILYLDHGRAQAGASQQNADGVAFLRDLNFTLKREHPDVWLVAEDSSAWPGITRAPAVGGLGFDLKWDMGFSHDMRRYLALDPIHRSHHQAVLTFRAVYMANEAFVIPLSHDDVVEHRGGALLQQMHGDPWQKLANLRLLLATAYAQPGKKLLFMGDEFAQPRAWDHDRSLDWHLATESPHDGIARMVQELNRLHREEPALHARDAGAEGFEWIDGTNAPMSVVVYGRRGERPEDYVVVACNYTPVPRAQYRIGVPRGGRWREIFNSDARDYGGSGHGNLGGVDAVPYPWNERRSSIVVTLPPLGVIFMRPE